jgi:hypothetical protein
MSAWQKDKQLARDTAKTVSELQQQIAQLQQSNAPKNDDDIEMPEEIANADPETQAGFRLIMKAMQGTMSKAEQKIYEKVLGDITKPLKEENEVATKVKQEVADLGVELGKDFVDNQKEVMKYAGDNNYPFGTLRQAYLAWQKDKKIAELEGKTKAGKQTIEEIDAEKAKQGEIPNGSANRTGVYPKWDEKRDGSKSLSQIFDDIKGVL